MNGKWKLKTMAIALATISSTTITTAGLAADEVNFVRMDAGLRLPLRLVTPMSTKLGVGSAIQAKLNNAVTLSGGEVLPAGTLVVGHAVSQTKACGLQISFDQLQLPNGTIIPIASHLVRGVDAQKVFVLELKEPAQVAVEGGVL